MSILKTVGVFGVIGGVGIIGYYLFKKYKPTIAQTQLEELSGQQYVIKEDKPEHRKIWSIVAQYGYDNLGKNQALLDLKKQLLTQNPLIISYTDYMNLSRFYEDMNEKGVFENTVGAELGKISNQRYWWEKRFKRIEDETIGFNKFGTSILGITNCAYNPIIEENPCGYNYNIRFQGSDYDYYQYAPEEYNRYFRDLPKPSGKDISIYATNCVELDQDIKRLVDRIAEQTRTAPNENHRRVLAWYKDILEDYFNLFSCRDKIETERTKTSIDLETKYAIKAEESIAKKSFSEQKTYIILGGLVLLTGVYAIVKK